MTIGVHVPFEKSSDSDLGSGRLFKKYPNGYRDIHVHVSKAPQWELFPKRPSGRTAGPRRTLCRYRESGVNFQTGSPRLP
eukprot:5066797-Prymnesium_polylepis.1